MAKEQAERRATAQLMFELGQKAYGKGMYGRAIEFLEGALTIIPRPTLFGGEVGLNNLIPTTDFFFFGFEMFDDHLTDNRKTCFDCGFFRVSLFCRFRYGLLWLMRPIIATRIALHFTSNWRCITPVSASDAKLRNFATFCRHRSLR